MQNISSLTSASSTEKRTSQVLEAIRAQLRQCRHNRGCSPKEIFGHLLKGCKSRNLALQLRAALKRAVAEGLVKLLAGRYLIVHPPAKKSSTSKSRKHKKSTKRKAKRANKQQHPAKSSDENKRSTR